MNKTLATVFVAGMLTGCTPTDLLQPTFPAVAPEKPVILESDKPRSSANSETRGPVTAKDISERNARQSLRDLDAELDQACDSGAKN